MVGTLAPATTAQTDSLIESLNFNYVSLIEINTCRKCCGRRCLESRRTVWLCLAIHSCQDLLNNDIRGIY